MLRRNFCGTLMAAGAIARWARAQAPAAGRVALERPMPGQPHAGRVLLAVQAHSDDIPLSASGTVAKLIEEGYTGYLVRATNDDMGDSPGWAHRAVSATTWPATSATTPRWRGYSAAKAISI